MVCRLCLTDLNLANIVSLFNEFGKCDDPQLLKIIAEHFHLNITWDDEVSTTICSKCYNHLNEFEKYCVFIREQQIKLGQKVPIVADENFELTKKHIKCESDKDIAATDEDIVSKELKYEPEEDIVTNKIQMQCVNNEDIVTKEVQVKCEPGEDIVTKEIQIKCEPEEAVITEMDLQLKSRSLHQNSVICSATSSCSAPSRTAARRTRKTDRGIKDFDALLDAIKAIKVYKKSRKSTAKAYNIDMRSLGRYVQKFDAVVPDITHVTDDELLKVVRQIASYSTPSLVFNEDQEKALVEYMIKCVQHYYYLSTTELKQLAYQFAIKINAEYPRSWDEYEMAGRQWYYGFMERHKKLSLRTPEQTSLNRVKSFCRENVDHFFQNLGSVLTIQQFTASSIWNMDVTGFSTMPTRMGKMISLKNVKRVGQITSAECDSMITLAFAVSASGNSMPPFYLFPGKNMNPLYLTHASNKSVGFANDTGWMQHAEFVKFMEHFIKHSHSSKSSPTLLLLDNHGSHLSVEAIDMAVENGVTMLSFPPHCSFRMQPLDVSVYGPVKGSYNQAHNAWMRSNAGKALDIALIPKLVATALLEGATAENIVDGFRRTGICPYDPGVFNDSHFVSLGVDKANAESSAIEREYDKNEQRCFAFNSALIDVTSSEPSTSGISWASIGPLRAAAPQKKSNLGSKPQKITVFTSSENVLKDQQKKRATAKEEKEASAEKKCKVSPKKAPK